MADDVPVEDLRAGDLVRVRTLEGPRLVRVTGLVPRFKGDNLVYRIDGCDQDGEQCSAWAVMGQLIHRVEFVDVGDGMPYCDPDFETFLGPWCNACLLPRHDWRRQAVRPPSGVIKGLEPCQLCGDTTAFWNDSVWVTGEQP